MLLWRAGLAPAFRFAPTVVMTTRGRKSGAARHVMTDCLTVDGRIYVVPGWGRRNQWYRNIEADPHLTVQYSGRTFAATAVRVTDPHELTTIFRRVPRVNPMWKRYLGSWDIEDNLDDFLAKRERIVVVRLSPSLEPPPLPPLPTDLWWVWPLAAAAVLTWKWGHRQPTSSST